MRGRDSILLVMLTVVMLAVPVAVRAQGTFTPIDYPGAANTWAMGINPQGDIVGYWGLNGVQHGFFLGRDASVPVSIDKPGACRTDAYAINPAGDIVGTYNDCTTGAQHGYLLRHGVFTSIDVPDATGTGAFGINPEGDIVGHFVSPMGKMNGFLLRNGRFTKYANDAAEATDNMTCRFGIDSQGQIVGHYKDDRGTHGYLLAKTGFTSIDIEGGMDVSTYGINPEGDIVGFYTELATGKIHGFSRDKAGVVTQVDAPDAVYTYVMKNNPMGDLVGYYRDASKKWHGFVMKR